MLTDKIKNKLTALGRIRLWATCFCGLDVVSTPTCLSVQESVSMRVNHRVNSRDHNFVNARGEETTRDVEGGSAVWSDSGGES